MRAIFWKELADHFGRRRFIVLLALVGFALIWGLFIDKDRVLSGGTGFFFLDLFTTTAGVPISLLFFIAFFGPIIGITLGFDAINSERSQGTLARVLAQPVYRDAVFNGKFLAALLALTVVVTGMLISVVGLGMFRLGMAPTGEEIIRLFGFGLVSIAYLGVWLALAMAASTFLRNVVASALLAIGLWMVFAFMVVLAAGAVADAVVSEQETLEQAQQHFAIENWIRRVSPSELYQEATGILLDPITGRTLTPFGLTDQTRLEGLLRTPVAASQSLQLVWPHIVVLLAMLAVALGASYARFMREEIRS